MRKTNIFLTYFLVITTPFAMDRLKPLEKLSPTIYPNTITLKTPEEALRLFGYIAINKIKADQIVIKDSIIKDLNLSNLNFNFMIFENCTLSNINFQGSTFIKSWFFNCKLENIDFNYCNFTDIFFVNSSFDTVSCKDTIGNTFFNECVFKNIIQ